MSHEDLTTRVLAWCNERRAEKGLESLERMCSGVPGTIYQCPVARTIEGLASLNAYWLDRDPTSSPPPGETPDFVGAWIRLFDADELPEYLDWTANLV